MYRGRFAPSPTGPLHFGSLIAAVASYADARAQRGAWLVRIEDVDLPRSQPDSEHDIVATLARYGFAWDEPIVRQSARTAAYAAALADLVARNLAYPCVCTRRDLQSAPVGAGGEHVYPGTCRGGISATRLQRLERSLDYPPRYRAPGQFALGSGPARSWRMRVGDAVVRFDDRLQGAQVQDLARDVGDFVVKRADGLFAYQLAVVVDDAAQSITHAVRGADLLASTPRQIHLQRALGLPQLTYLHVPVAIDRTGEKLSKQTHAAALPDDPLPTLLAAWRFLDQPNPISTPHSVAEFWEFAARTWTPSRLPPAPMLPAPAV